jgi:type I restriction enzyme S subunit
VTIPSLTKADLLKISMPVPSLSLQRDFAKRIEVIEQQKEQISSTIKDLETLLASRMQYWFD